MPFYLSLRSYSRRFLVFTCFSRLKRIDARRMPSRPSEKCENLKNAEKRGKFENDRKNTKNNEARKVTKLEASRERANNGMPLFK